MIYTPDINEIPWLNFRRLELILEAEVLVLYGYDATRIGSRCLLSAYNVTQRSTRL